MKVFSLLIAQMSQLVSNKGVLYSVIAALLVPVVYGGILLSADWGPYDNLSNLPVAVVNNDKGAMSGDEPLNVGEDLVADLKKSKDLGWSFVDSEEAEKGLDSFKYYMVIEIPEDFSERVTTVMEPDPKKLELNYIQNEGLNFMAAQVTRSATEKLREKLANKVTEKYASNIFASLGDVSEGFKSAADGSSKLHDGTIELYNGTGLMLNSLTEKTADISKLAAGTVELKNGTGQLVSSLSSKQSDISKLANGSKQLEAGTAQLVGTLSAKQGDITKLADGSKVLKAGTGELLSSLTQKSDDIATLAKGSSDMNTGTGLLLQALKDKQPGINQLAAGGKLLGDKVPELKDGTDQVLAGLQKAQTAVKTEIAPGSQLIAGGVGEVIENSRNLGNNLQALTSLLNAYYEQNKDTLSKDPAFLTILGTANGIKDAATNTENAAKLQALQDGANRLAAAFNEKIPADKGSLAAGINDLVAGQTAIDQGVGALAASAPVLSAGTASVASGWEEIITNVSKLHAGSTLIAEGNKSVNTGWGTMTAGVTALDNGAAQISAGNVTVDKGWRELTTGASKIHTGVAQVSDGNTSVDKGWKELTVGASKLHSGAVQISDGNASVEKGWGDLTDGVTKLNDGAGKLNDGSGELAAGLRDGAEKTGKIKADDKNIGMFASPVELVSNKVNEYPFYRDSTAPYVMTLALFAGILIMSLFMNIKKTEDVHVTGLTWFGAKFMNLAFLAVIQAVLLSVVVLWFLDLEVANPAGFILFAILASIAFAAIVLFFSSFGNIGRFILFVLIVMQLSTTGANLPIDMLPENLRNMSVFMPFTYSIAGFKALISLNDFGGAMANLGVLLVFMALFTLLTITVYVLKIKDHSQQNDLAV